VESWRGDGENEGLNSTEGKEGVKEMRGRREGKEGEGICWTNAKLIHTRLTKPYRTSKMLLGTMR